MMSLCVNMIADEEICDVMDVYGCESSKVFMRTKIEIFQSREAGKDGLPNPS